MDFGVKRCHLVNLLWESIQLLLDLNYFSNYLISQILFSFLNKTYWLLFCPPGV